MKTEKAEQIEIPFVPASERQAREDVKMEVIESDSIVVVGRAKKRRRVQSAKQQAQTETDIDGLGNAESAAAAAESRQKRAKGSQSGKASTMTSEASHSDSKALETKAEFDYASAPNFLDDAQPIPAATPVTKAKKLKNANGTFAMPLASLAHERPGLTIRVIGRSAAETSGPVFPRPPRANNEPKGANKSYTFGR